jgi:hypothetical protein
MLADSGATSVLATGVGAREEMSLAEVKRYGRAMRPLSVALTTAGALFVGTNLDDMVVLAVLNASARAGGRPKVWHIWAGQYVGIAILVGVSVLGALGLTVLLDNRVWLLGLVPLGLGVYKFGASLRARSSGEPLHLPQGRLAGLLIAAARTRPCTRLEQKGIQGSPKGGGSGQNRAVYRNAAPPPYRARHPRSSTQLP